MLTAAWVDHLQIPMKVPVSHARATRSVAESVVLRVELFGAPGAGECVPRDYVTGETPRGAFAALTSCDLAAIARRVDGQSFEAAVRSVEALDLPRLLQRGAAKPALAAACALELAL